MKLHINAGETSKRIPIFIQDSSSTTGDGLTGLLFSTSGLTWYYWREDEGNVDGTQVTLATATRGTYASGGLIEKDATNMPGFYEIGIPDAALAASSKWVTMILKGAADMAPLTLEIQLDLIDNVWNEVLTGATHNVANSAGRRLRQLQEVGQYELGLLWLDLLTGTAGTTSFENGTATNPSLTLADANTILGNLPLHGIHFGAGSSVVFVAAQENQELAGDGWIVALGGQSIAGSAIHGAVVSGISTGVPSMVNDCFLNASTFAGGDFVDFGFNQNDR